MSLPGFRRLPDSSVKDWHGEDAEAPGRYVLGMQAALEANISKECVREAKALFAGAKYVVMLQCVQILGAVGWQLFGLPWAGLWAVPVVAGAWTVRVALRVRTLKAESERLEGVAKETNREIETQMRMRIIGEPKNGAPSPQIQEQP